MLFGPIRAYDKLESAYRSLSLRGVVQSAGGTPEIIGVYACSTEEFEDTLLQDVFNHRRCTPTNAALYPGFGTHLPVDVITACNSVDQLVLTNMFTTLPQESLAPFQDTVLREPTHDRQKDATENAPTPKRRQLAPG